MYYTTPVSIVSPMIRLASAGILIHCVHLDGQSLKDSNAKAGIMKQECIIEHTNECKLYVRLILRFYNQYLNFCPWIMF